MRTAVRCVFRFGQVITWEARWGRREALRVRSFMWRICCVSRCEPWRSWNKPQRAACTVRFSPSGCLSRTIRCDIRRLQRRCWRSLLSMGFNATCFNAWQVLAHLLVNAFSRFIDEHALRDHTIRVQRHLRTSALSPSLHKLNMSTGVVFLAWYFVSELVCTLHSPRVYFCQGVDIDI